MWVQNVVQGCLSSLSGPNDSWFVQFEDGRCRWEGIPPRLAMLINECNQVDFIALGPNNTYVLITDRYA